MTVNWTIQKRFFLNSTDEGKKEYLKQDGSFIRYIKNPTREMKLIAVKENGYNIEFIKEQDEEIQVEAVKSEGGAIDYIENPSYIVQLESIKSSPLYINDKIKTITKEMQEIICERFCSTQHSSYDDLYDLHEFKEKINEFDEKLIIKMIRVYGNLIRIIKNPTEEMKLEAVKQNGYAIQHIREQTEELQLEAIKNLGRMGKIYIFLCSLINPSEKVKIEAAKKIESSLRYFKNPSFNLIKTSIENFPRTAIMMLPQKYQTEEVQLFALEKNIDNIRYLKNPKKKALKYFLDNYDIGEYVNIRPSIKVCKGCKEQCFYKFNNGIYDGCPRFLEHLSLKNKKHIK